MNQVTNAERQRKFKAAMRAKGFALVADWIPTDKKKQHKEYCKRLRGEK